MAIYYFLQITTILCLLQNFAMNYIMDKMLNPTVCQKMI